MEAFVRNSYPLGDGFVNGIADADARTSLSLLTHDWSQTPLGSPETWSQSFRTALSICQTSPLPMLIWWGQERILLYNDACHSWFGSRHPIAFGQPGAKACSELWQQVAPALEHIFATGATRDLHNPVLQLQGSGDVEERYFTASHSAIAGETGTVEGVLTVVIDISDRIRAEEALRRREEELRLITNAVPALIAYVDAQQHYRFNNRRYEEWFGRPVTELYGLHLRDMMGESGYQRICPYVEQVLSGQAVTFEMQTNYPNVGIRYASASYTPHLNSQGNVEGFVVLVNDITEYKQIEAALRSSNERLALASQAAQIGMFEWNIQTNEVFWTEEEEALYGLPPAGFGGSFENWKQAVHPDDRYRAEQDVLQAVANDTDLNTEFRVIWSDGSIHWLYARAKVFFDEVGNPLRMLGVNVDITDRKQAEIALRESEEKLSLFIRQAPVSVAMLDRNMRYITTSQRWVDIYKIGSIEAVIGRSHYDLFPSLPDSWKQVHQKCLAGAVQKCDEDWFLLPDGSQQWLRWEVRPWYDSTGEVGGIVIFSEDISDRKRAEAEREQLLQQLEVSLGQLEAVINNMTEGLIIADAQGNILMFNPVALALHGYNSVEQVRQHLDEFHHIFEAHDLQGNFIPVEEWPIAKALRGETFSNWEIHIRRLDTGKTWIGSYGGTPVRDQQGRIVLAIVTMHDVTDERQAQAELARSLAAEQAARADAEAANRVKDEFLAILSHELRTPLNPILGWTKLLRTRQFNPEMTDRALETIERNAKLQTQLIEDLLDVSRILRGKLVLDVCPVNLVMVIEAALETVRLAAEAKGIQMQKFFATNVGQVSAESARLQQVVWNLLSNAVKFTPTGGQIEVRLEQVNSVAQIQVKDTGKGISQEFLPYVFEYFRQEDGTTTRQFGGLGLGLAIVRHLVELHGGTVQAESPGEGMGATFTVQFPLLATVSKLDLDSPLTHQTLNLSGIRVLIVDDEADMRELVSFILQEHGAQVTVAASAQEALQLLAQSMPDVLLSDIGMPDMDGYTLMRQVRTLPPKQGGLICAIALTAYAGELDRQQALAAGFQQHISKPVEPEKLVEAIANLLRYN